MLVTRLVMTKACSATHLNGLLQPYRVFYFLDHNFSRYRLFLIACSVLPLLLCGWLYGRLCLSDLQCSKASCKEAASSKSKGIFNYYLQFNMFQSCSVSVAVFRWVLLIHLLFSRALQASLMALFHIFWQTNEMN